MSLRVWLPLTKDLRNQGLDDVTVSGGTIDNNGKLGKCYLVTKTNYMVITQSISTTSEWTINFWMKLPSSMNNATVWEQMFVFPTVKDDTGANGSSTINWASYHNVKIWDDAYHQWFWASPGTHFNYDKWHMWTIAHTTNGSGVTGKIYIDGNLIGTYNNTTHQMKIRPGNILIGSGISTGGFYINDFRLYDHCLSPLEVKQISQGLILHYPLNRNGWGQENLIVGSQLNGNFTYPSSSYKDWYAPTTTVIPSGSTYTLSFDAKSTVSGDKVVTHYYSPNTTTGVKTSQEYTSSAGDGYAPFTLTTEWQRYWVTYTQSSTTAVKHLICPRLTSGNGTGTVSVKNVKFEEGSIPTPWCPNSSDALATTMGLNDNVEYDTSGYGNNGTKVGTTYSSDTPKYNVSTVFDGNADTITVRPCYSVGQTIDTMSCAIWFKTNTLNSTSPNLVSLGENSFFRFRLASETSIWYYIVVAGQTIGKTFSCKTLTDNVWHHIVIVFDKGDVYSYIDGELVNTANWTSTGTYLTCGAADDHWHLARYRIASEAFKGNESDFRIYATALSADDVKSLYNNSAYIDNQGNIYGAVYEEV